MLLKPSLNCNREQWADFLCDGLGPWKPAMAATESNSAFEKGLAEGVSPLPRIPLPSLQATMCATIVAIDATDDDTQRLKAMGVCLGRKVEMVQGGDPLILRVLGSRLGISARLAARVYVDSCHNPNCTEPNHPLKKGSIKPPDQVSSHA